MSHILVIQTDLRDLKIKKQINIEKIRLEHEEKIGLEKAEREERIRLETIEREDRLQTGKIKAREIKNRNGRTRKTEGKSNAGKQIRNGRKN